jgi:antitoxin FitA
VPKTIQIRGVSPKVLRALKERAARAGISLSAYLLAELNEIAERPTWGELRERLAQRKPTPGDVDAARLVREERENRENRENR